MFVSYARGAKVFMPLAVLAILTLALQSGAQEQVARARRPARPPHGAIVLFNSKDVSQWSQLDCKPVQWTVADGVLEVKPGTGNIVSRQKFGDYQLHIEFNIPLMP